MKFATFFTALSLFASTIRAADIPDSIKVWGSANQNKAIPIALSGYSGEADSVLRFDLFVQGFEVVSVDKAVFQLSGSNGGQVEGRLSDVLTKQPIFAKAYSGASLRSQAHALADDVVFAITKSKGIGRSKIAYRRDVGDASEIMVADFDGYRPVAATADGGALVVSPTWRPGKRMLFYTSYKMGNPDIFSHDLDSGERRVVARYWGANISPAVSPDGRHLAMVLSKSGSPNIWVADIDGSNLRQLTTIREGVSSPCWSPDGRTICFSSQMTGGSALYTIPSTGGSPHRLKTIGTPNATEPDWSPDGKTIVFTSLMGNFQVCTVPSSGGEAAVVAAGEDPKWAANSRTVLFSQRRGSKSILSMLDVFTKRVKELPTNSGSCSQPSWSK